MMTQCRSVGVPLKIRANRLLWALTVLFIGCVEGRQRPNQAIVSPIFDWGQQTPIDVAVPLDSHPDMTSFSPERDVFVVVDSLPYALGYRAGLQPQHRARYGLADMLNMTRSTAFILSWDGPAGIRDEGLQVVAEQAHRLIPMLVVREGARSLTLAELEANIQFLGEWQHAYTNAVHKNGRPVIAVDLTGEIGPFQEQIGRLLERLGLSAMTRVSSGQPPPLWSSAWWSDCHGDDFDSSSGDVAPLLCVTPNLDHSDRDADFARRLGEARHICDVQGCAVLVDGVGRWAGDRQIDPIFGAPTTLPGQLTHGRRIVAYGYRRLYDTNRLLADGVAGFSADAFSEPRQLLGGASIEFNWGQDGLSLELIPHSDSIRILLNQTPILLSPGTRCRVGQLSGESSLTMRFADGFVHRWAPSADVLEDWVVTGHVRRLEDVLFDAAMTPSGAQIRMNGFKCSIP